MKRGIVCLLCGQELKQILPSEPGEYSKFVSGLARYGCDCSHCDVDIPKGTQCEAISLWTDSVPYEGALAPEDTYIELPWRITTICFHLDEGGAHEQAENQRSD